MELLSLLYCVYVCAKLVLFKLNVFQSGGSHLDEINWTFKIEQNRHLDRLCSQILQFVCPIFVSYVWKLPENRLKTTRTWETNSFSFIHTHVNIWR